MRATEDLLSPGAPRAELARRAPGVVVQFAVSKQDPRLLTNLISVRRVLDLLCDAADESPRSQPFRLVRL